MFDDLNLTPAQIQELLADPNLAADLQAKLAAVQGAPTAPVGAIVATDPFGVIHVTPGAMGTLPLMMPWPHVDLEVDGTGHFTSFSSDNENVISADRLQSFVGSPSASAAVFGYGTANLSIGYIDMNGNAQTAVITVTAG